MKNRTLFLLFFIFFSNILFSKNIFIAIKNGEIVKTVGDVHERHSPYSTFKIPLALIGFAECLFKDETSVIKLTPEIESRFITYYDPVKYPIMKRWKKDQTLRTYLLYSAIWISRYITHILGRDKFKSYLEQFEYGNKDISNEDALMNAWLDSTIKISALEQVKFIEKLVKQDLPVEKDAQEKTAKILKLEVLFDEWQLYGKTGGSRKLGWFVGWIKKNETVIIFAQYIEKDKDDEFMSGGLIAKETAKNHLIELMND
jgi:beta-lactamase class D